MKMYGFVKVGIASKILPYYGLVQQCEIVMKNLCRLSRRTWTDYENGLIAQIRGQMKKIYDFNAMEELENFNMDSHRYDIELNNPEYCNMFYKMIVDIAEKQKSKNMKLYVSSPIEINNLSEKKCKILKNLLFKNFNVPDSFLKKLDYPYMLSLNDYIRCLHGKFKFRNERKYYKEIEIKSNLPSKSGEYKYDCVKLCTSIDTEDYIEFIEEYSFEIKHLKLQEPWNYLQVFHSMAKSIEISVNELELITNKPISSSDDIGNIVSCFPYIQILSFYTRNVDDFGKICMFMKDKTMDLITKIYKLQYNYTMLAHTILHGCDSEFEVFINLPNEESKILKIKCDSFSILIWQNMEKNRYKFIHDETNPYYLFKSNYGVILKGTIDISVMNEYELRNIVPEVFDIGTNIQ